MLWTPCTNVKPRYEHKPHIIRKHPIGDSCIAAWLFNEGAGSIIYDARKSSIGTFVNQPYWTPENVGFDGVDDRISVPSSAILMPAKEITIYAIFKPITFGAYKVIIWKNGSYALQMDSSAGNYLRGGIWTSSSHRFDSTINAMSANLWYHAAMTAGDGNQILYLNGSSVGSQTYTNADIGTTSYNVEIGGTSGYCLNSKIDFIAIFSRVLKQAELISLLATPFQFLESAKPVMYSFGSEAGGTPQYLASTIACQSSVSVALRVGKPLSATVASQSTMAAALRVEKPLGAIISCQSSVNASLRVEKPLSATIASQSAVTVGLRVEKHLSSAVACQSTVTASVVTPVYLSATITATSSVSAALLVQKTLAITIQGQSSVSAGLRVEKRLAATVTGLATITVNIHILPFIYPPDVTTHPFKLSFRTDGGATAGQGAKSFTPVAASGRGKRSFSPTATSGQGRRSFSL